MRRLILSDKKGLLMGISGHATPEGTAQYAQIAYDTHRIASNHIRPPFQHLHLTSLGLGTYLGDPDEPTDSQVRNAVVRSVSSGAVNVLDTAINYRFQKAERAMGSALVRLIQTGIPREAVFICSKNGFLTPDADQAMDFREYIMETLIDPGIIQPDEIAGGMHCMTPAFLNDQLNRSLSNLGLETLDLMYLHNAAESQMPVVGRDVFMNRLAAAFECYESARRDNRIRYYGMATWDCFRVSPQNDATYLGLETVVQLAEQVGGPDHGFRFIQLPFNMAFMEAGLLKNQPVQGIFKTCLEAAHDLGIGVFTSVPLLQGQLLTHPLPRFKGLTTPAQHCLQRVRSQPGILAPLIGHKTPVHVEENLKVAWVSPVGLDELAQCLAAV